MNLWDRMISGIADAVTKYEVSEDALLEQMETAVRESTLWTEASGFVDPEVVEKFQKKWTSTFYAVKQKTGKFTYTMGLSGGKIRTLAPQFLELYSSLPEALREHNQVVAQRKIKFAASIVQPVETHNLDKQQMSCIVKEARNHLVLAGAGTGKTYTIVGYVKYLLLSGKCRAEDILVLSYTRASAEEISRRILDETRAELDALTFHKLGLNVITKAQGVVPNINSSDIRQFVSKQFETLVKDERYLEKLCNYLAFGGSAQRSEFDFENQADYDAYLNFNPPTTLKGETVKSYGEMDIANFLYQQGISYEYEPSYPLDTRTTEYGQYHPDFYLPNFDVYIEYFGVNRNGEVPSYFKGRGTKSASDAYREGMKWKRELHKQQNTRLIELYAYEKFEETLLQSLGEKLKRAGVVTDPQTVDELFQKICGNGNRPLDRVAELFGTVISLMKSNNCSVEEVRVRNRSLRNLPSIEAALDLIAPIYTQYQSALKSNGEIDFNDMINLAAEFVANGAFQHSYQYVIVDEYQDISQSRYRLLATMRQQRDFKLFCVGDDWQSIYRFSGSDIGFILNFEKYWGASEISRIETTYRFPQSLIEISGKFVMQNPAQVKKSLRSAESDSGFSMEPIRGYTEKNAVEFMTERLRDLPKNSSVMFLGRYRYDIRALDSNRTFRYHYDAGDQRIKVVFAPRTDLDISYLTAHSSKGLQADYVFLLNNKRYGMGFPSQISDAPVLQLLLDNCDSFPFAEERRLFYVAMTRAKKKVWLLMIKGNESVFAQELEAAFGVSMKREQYTCPLCGGKLVRHSGPYGEFFGCSNYRTSGCAYKRNINRSASYKS